MSNYSQKYEYTTANVTRNHYDVDKNLKDTLNTYAKQGWRYVDKYEKSDNIMLMFERQFGDYKNYNDEVINYIQDAK